MLQYKEPLNIVVLGASFAGLSVAHHFLDRTLARLGTTSAAPTYRLVVISPSTHVYWNIGAPRKLVANNLIKDDEAFIPIEPGFKRHKLDDDEFTFIQGSCMSWDPETREVTVEPIGALAEQRCSRVSNSRASQGTPTTPKSPNVTTTGSSGAQQTISYHALIVATGTSAHSDYLSLHGSHEKTLAALKAFHKRVPTATSIVVAGGGPSGVETAGQLATYLNGHSIVPSIFVGRQQKNLDLADAPKKTITLITSGDGLLPNLPPAVGLKAEKQLKSLGVHLIKDTRVSHTQLEKPDPAASLLPYTNSAPPARPRTRVVLSTGDYLVADLFVAATGVAPNTAFVPPRLLSDSSYLLTSSQTLRVPGAGDRVYALGDCASYSSNYVLDVYGAVAPLMTNLANDLEAYELRLANEYGGNEDRIAAMTDAIMVRKERIEGQLCPITRRGGVGVLFGVALPSFVVYLFKGRDYVVSKGKKVVVDGNNPYPE